MEENKLLTQNELAVEDIKNLIYTIRGKQVMTDSDVANIYHCETKYVNRVVKRNIERFPEEFCFQLNEEEFEVLRCQFVTLNQNGRGQHRKYLPYVFTEQGIAMLSALLKSDVAVSVSVNIMKAFIEMRKFLMINGQVFERLTSVEHKLLEHDKKIDKVFNSLQLEENIKQRIFFDGQIYDAYSIIVDIIRKANKKILIIDNYVDDSVLKMLTKKKNNVEVVILTSDKSNIQQIDIQKFNKEYPILKVTKTNKFHDRFIVIDNKEMYHLGASIKDLGKKCFGINKIEEVIAFLNYKEGGIIYVGINKNGQVVGVENTDLTQLQIKDRIKNNIQPSTLGLFDVTVETIDNKEVIKVIISSGTEKPYYLRKKGRTPEGCYIKVGSSKERMTERMIDDMYARRIKNTLKEIDSPRQELTFNQLKIYYEEHGLKLNDNFLPNLDLLTSEGKYNYNAFY